MPGIRGRRQHMGWFDPDNDRSRELRFLIFSPQFSAGCTVVWFLWSAHDIAQNKDRIQGFSKAPILLWHTVGSFSSFFDGKESQLSKDEAFPFHIYARNSAQESEWGTWLQARVQIISSAPADQGLGRYKRYIQLQIYGQYQHDESDTKRSKKVLRVSRTREGIQIQKTPTKHDHTLPKHHRETSEAVPRKEREHAL